MKIFNALLVSWICTFLVFYPAISHASEPEPFPIKEGEAAPFDGVLLRTADAATLLSNLEQQTARCQANIDLAVSTAVAAKQHEFCNPFSARVFLLCRASPQQPGRVADHRMSTQEADTGCFAAPIRR